MSEPSERLQADALNRLVIVLALQSPQGSAAGRRILLALVNDSLAALGKSERLESE